MIVEDIKRLVDVDTVKEFVKEDVVPAIKKEGAAILVRFLFVQVAKKLFSSECSDAATVEPSSGTKT